METIQINLSKIAKAAALKIQPEEEEQFKNEIKSIVSMLTELKSVDTTNVPPLMTVSKATLQMREDIAQDPQSDVKVKQSSNSMKHSFFITPKVVD